MKNIIALLIISIVLISCSLNKLEKPFIIIRKGSGSEDTNTNLTFYVYQDKNGYVENFYDKDRISYNKTLEF